MRDGRLTSPEWRLEVTRTDLALCRYEREELEPDRVGERAQHMSQAGCLRMAERSLDD